MGTMCQHGVCVWGGEGEGWAASPLAPLLCLAVFSEGEGAQEGKGPRGVTVASAQRPLRPGWTSGCSPEGGSRETREAGPAGALLPGVWPGGGRHRAARMQEGPEAAVRSSAACPDRPRPRRQVF